MAVFLELHTWSVLFALIVAQFLTFASFWLARRFIARVFRKTIQREAFDGGSYRTTNHRVWQEHVNPEMSPGVRRAGRVLEPLATFLIGCVVALLFRIGPSDHRVVFMLMFAFSLTFTYPLVWQVIATLLVHRPSDGHDR